MLQVFSSVAPVDVVLGNDVQAGIRYGNPPSSESRTGVICANIVQDGCALAFKHPSVSDIRGSDVSPLGAVEGRQLRIIHDLTFARYGYRLSVNDDSDLSAAQPCELGHIFGDVCRWILYLRQRHGAFAASYCAILMSKTCCARLSPTPCVLLILVTFSASAPSCTCSCSLDGVAAPAIETL